MLTLAIGILSGIARAETLPDRGYLPGAPPPLHLYGPADTTVTIEVQPLADGVYAARINFVWTGWVVLPDGILLIDSSFDQRSAMALADTISARSGAKPVRWVVNTHSHEDHIGGDLYFATRGASLIAQTNQAGRIDSMVAEQYKLESAAKGEGTVGTKPKPCTRVAHRMKLGPSARPVEIIWLGHPAHTSGDLIVYLPKQKIVFAGDLISNRAIPWMLDPNMSVNGWNASIDSLVTARFAIATLVPGHGTYAPPYVSFSYTRGYLKDANAKATQTASWGTTAAQVRDWGYLGPYEDSEFYAMVHFLNMRRLYNIAKGIKTPGRSRAGAVQH